MVVWCILLLFLLVQNLWTTQILSSVLLIYNCDGDSVGNKNANQALKGLILLQSVYLSFIFKISKVHLKKQKTWGWGKRDKLVLVKIHTGMVAVTWPGACAEINKTTDHIRKHGPMLLCPLRWMSSSAHSYTCLFYLSLSGPWRRRTGGKTDVQELSD